MDSTVASMLTTTPFFKPFDSCCPKPITSCLPSGMTSATTATILDVPISRPTIRFFASFVMSFQLPLFAFSIPEDGHISWPTHSDNAYLHFQYYLVHWRPVLDKSSLTCLPATSASNHPESVPTQPASHYSD